MKSKTYLRSLLVVASLSATALPVAWAERSLVRPHLIGAVSAAPAPIGAVPALEPLPENPGPIQTDVAPPAPPAPPVAPAQAGPADALEPLDPVDPPRPPKPEGRKSKGRSSSGDLRPIKEEANRLARETERMAEQIHEEKIQRDAALIAEMGGRARDVKITTRDGRKLALGGEARRRTRTLLLPAEGAPGESQEQLNEDLRVMHRILLKASSRKNSPEPFRIAFARPDAPELDALYLGGYGAIFLLSVDFPLVETPRKTADEPAAGAPDDVWEKTRRSLKRVDDDGEMVETVVTTERSPGVWVSETEVQAYDAERVEGLKKRLTEAFKHAANIRHLKPDETVTFVVASRSPAAGGGVTRLHLSTPGGVGGATSGFTFAGGDESGGGRLVFRARKSDIDALAAGKLKPADFPVKITCEAP